MRLQFYWRGMWTDCITTARSCPVRQKEQARFPQPPYLMTTERMSEPFRCWAVDSIVKLYPPAPDGSTDVMIALDPFVRWLEVGKLPTLNLHETTCWFHEQVTCRYGLPFIVQSDRGPEYQGAFDRYMKANGIQHRLISTAHPRANGLAERMVRTVKALIRKFLLHCEGGRWWEVLGDVARAVRILPSRATGCSPYLLVFKMQPLVAVHHEVRALTEPEFLEQAEQRIEAEVGLWQELFKEVRQRHDRYDAKMVRDYLRRQSLAEQDVRFLFSAGDKVLLRARIPGKLTTKVLGPFIFTKYTGPLQVTAQITALNGRSRIVSAANLLPMRPATAIPQGLEDDGEDVGDTWDDGVSDSETESGSGGAATGVRVLEQYRKQPRGAAN